MEESGRGQTKTFLGRLLDTEDYDTLKEGFSFNSNRVV